MKRIVLAYSGSVATSAAIPWLREQQNAEVVTVTLDLGQERELAAVRERALALGAARAHVASRLVTGTLQKGGIVRSSCRETPCRLDLQARPGDRRPQAVAAFAVIDPALVKELAFINTHHFCFSLHQGKDFE